MSSKKPKGYVQKFHVGHFTKGTEVLINTGFSEGAWKAKVESIISNGPNSWVIYTDQPRLDHMADVDSYRIVNIDHVKQIIKRAEGRVTYHVDNNRYSYFDECYLERAMWSNKPKSCYVGTSPSAIVSMLLSTHPDFQNPTMHDHTFNIDALMAAFAKQMPGKRSKVEWVLHFNKQRAVKVLKQLIAKHKMSRRKAAREYEAYMNDCFSESMDIEWQRGD